MDLSLVSIPSNMKLSSAKRKIKYLTFFFFKNSFVSKNPNKALFFFLQNQSTLIKLSKRNSKAS